MKRGKEYSSSSTVSLCPEPTLHSILHLECELRIVMHDTADVVGALVYCVKAVKAEASVHRYFAPQGLQRHRTPLVSKCMGLSG